MKRKLFSTLLCAFALLLLMGASVETESTETPVIEEESISAVQQEQQVLETGISAGEETDTTDSEYIRHGRKNVLLKFGGLDSESEEPDS